MTATPGGVVTPACLEGHTICWRRADLAVRATWPPARGTVEVTVEGELDLATGELLEQVAALVAGPGVEVVADVANLCFCDLAGARSLLRAAELTESAGGVFSLARARPALLRVYELAGLPAPELAPTPRSHRERGASTPSEGER